jgi:hypothetical protein
LEGLAHGWEGGELGCGVQLVFGVGGHVFATLTKLSTCRKEMTRTVSNFVCGRA